MHLIKEIGLWNKTCKISLHIMEGKEFAYCTSEYLQGLEHSRPPALKNSPQPSRSRGKFSLNVSSVKVLILYSYLQTEVQVGKFLECSLVSHC